VKTPFLFTALALCCLGGCTHIQLEKCTVEQMATQSDIYYREVLNNLAMASMNHGALPYFSIFSTGQVQITDTGSTTDSVIPNSGITGLTSGNYGLAASRADQLNWTIWPISDPDRLRLMRCAYQISLGTPTNDCDNCQQLVTLLCQDQCKQVGPAGALVDPAKCSACMACNVPTGWFCMGCKKDVPRDACYVGHYRDRYVWVMSDGVEGLTRLTFTILDIATINAGAAIQGPPGPLPSAVPGATATPQILKPRMSPLLLTIPNVPTTPGK
jgi:hypothetical protein